MQSLVITSSNQKRRAELARSLAAGKSSKFDTIVVDTTEVRGIDAVRAVSAATSRKPFDSAQTSVLILEAQNLTIEAQNALLKLLEEPPELAQIILTAPSKDLLLPTVASRLAEISLDKVRTWVSDTDTEVSDTKASAATALLSNLKQQKLSQRLAEIEKLPRGDYLEFWAQALKIAVLNKSADLKTIHRYNKLILKMIKAEKALVNKRLIDLILALEIPL